MKEQILAERYARALVQLGSEERSLERFREELGCFADLIDLEPNVLKILSLRELTFIKRAKILEDIMQKLNLSLHIQNFLCLLLRRGRINLFAEIEAAFEDFVREIEGIAVAHVKVADLQSGKQMSSTLRQVLEKIAGKKVEFDVEEDKTLIGGVQISLGDKIYDASIAGELERIKEQWI